jgi:hypothetical protein
MPKFNVGDVVYCTLNEGGWDDSLTVVKCGDGSADMKSAVSGFPMEVKSSCSRDGYNSVQLTAPEFGRFGSWWFHEDDLEFFNLSLENK